jgi:acyl-CoA thioester hydrolase
MSTDSAIRCHRDVTLRAVSHVESRVRVRYKETDQMGIAHHANYIVWFEIGRTDLCRQAGFPYTVVEERGYLLVVTEITCRYRTPFRYDDEVVIRTSLAEAASRSLRFAYELWDAAGAELRASGSSAHLWLDRATRKPVRADAEVIRAFAPYLPTSA